MRSSGSSLLLVTCVYHIIATCHGSKGLVVGENTRGLSSRIENTDIGVTIAQTSASSISGIAADETEAPSIAASETSAPSITLVEDDSATEAPTVLGNDANDSSAEETSAPTFSPTVAETLSQTLPPTLSPTKKPTQFPTARTNQPTVMTTPSPTRAPTPSPTRAPTPSPTRAPTRAPTHFPTHAPVQFSSRTGAPSALPTANDLLAQLRYPNELSTKITNAFYSFVGLIAICWVAVTVFFFGRKHGYIQLPTDKERLLALSKAKSQKNRVKKFEDYWDTGSEMSDDSVSKFPNRAAAASTFDDYWDDNIEFSTHSTEGFNLSRNL